MSEPIEHGTVRGARAEQKARTQARKDGVPEDQLPDMCDVCRQAWNDHQAVWYAKNRKMIAANRAARKAVS